MIDIDFVEFFDYFLRSGRRGRRFESCRSDQDIRKIITFWVVMAGGFGVNRRNVLALCPIPAAAGQ
jgi:hypothetical protein